MDARYWIPDTGKTGRPIRAAQGRQKTGSQMTERKAMNSRTKKAKVSTVIETF